MRPKVDPAQSAEAQATGKLHEEVYQVVSFDYVDWHNSDITHIGTQVWEDLTALFDGDDYDKPAIQLQPAPNNNFKLLFVKPIWMHYILVKVPAALLPFGCVTVAQIRYVDGTLEFLVHGTLTDGGYDTFAPPTKAVPVMSVQFWSTAAAPLDVYELIITMAQVGSSGAGPVPPASANQFYTDSDTTPVPAGALGANLVFGFDSIAIMFRNGSSVLLEISEDAGVTWEKIQPRGRIWFDMKRRSSIRVRDPAGAGGQAYEFWAW